MTQLTRSLLIASALALAAPWALAAKADRDKPLVLVFDKPGEVDKVKQRAEFNGAILTQGTLELRAERIDVKETAEGYHQVYANGSSARQVTFRQARDNPGERLEARADQIEYDTRSDTVRLIGNAEAKVMRGDQLVDLVSGAAINYDNRSERFGIEPGASAPHPSGRGRVVFMPRSASAAEPAASAPALPLKASPGLTPRQPQ